MSNEQFEDGPWKLERLRAMTPRGPIWEVHPSGNYRTKAKAQAMVDHLWEDQRQYWEVAHV